MLTNLWRPIRARRISPAHLISQMRLVAAFALCLSAVRAFNVPLSTSASWLARIPSITSARATLGARPAWTTLRAQIDAAPEGPGLSGWATNPAVRSKIPHKLLA